MYKAVALIISFAILFSQNLAAQPLDPMFTQIQSLNAKITLHHPIGSLEFLSEQRADVLKILQTAPSSADNQQNTNVPDVSRDMRLKQNLLLMLTTSGTAPNLHPYIFGGTDVPASDMLYTVQVQGTLGETCTGTLISSSVVLTAGHCVCSMKIAHVFFGSNASLNSGTIINVKEAVPETECSASASNQYVDAGRDLGLVWLTKNANTSPATIAQPNLIDQSHGITAVGFGYTEKLIIGVKKQAAIPIVSSNCSGDINNESDSAYYGCIKTYELVAAVSNFSPVRKDTCLGDSGGPIFIQSASSQFLLAGTTSRGVKGIGGCGYGGIYELLDQRAINWLVSKGLKLSYGS